MKVLLINPLVPVRGIATPPFGSFSLAAYLSARECEVLVEDYIVRPYSRERVREVIASFRPNVVGSTAVTMNVKRALSILRDYREENPEGITVMGGPSRELRTPTPITRRPPFPIT